MPTLYGILCTVDILQAQQPCCQMATSMEALFMELFIITIVLLDMCLGMPCT